MINFKISFMSYLLRLPVIILFLPVFTLGEENFHDGKEGKDHIHGIHQECPLPKSQADIVECAMDFHPSVKRSELEINSLSNLQKQASQIPNPTFSSRYVKDNNDSSASVLETNLSFTLEMGGKRSSRINLAQAKKAEAQASSEALKAEIKILTILNMHRLRQVLEEKKLLSEALTAFSKVIDQLKKLPRLSAEQEASLTLFEFALEEVKVNESELFEEERKLEHYFHIATGHSVDEIKAYLPESPKKWPKISATNADAKSPEVKKLLSMASLAQKEFEIQKSEAWSNITIGPSFTLEKEAHNETKLIGINFEIPIPLFQINGGAKAYAKSEVYRADQNVSLTKAEESHERFEQLRVYESLVSILGKTMKQDMVANKHDRIETLYLRGVVSSSVFLDSLKQKLSYLRSRNERELTALNALWSIYKYDGKIFEEKL